MDSDVHKIATFGYTVEEVARAMEAVCAAMPSVADITIPRIPSSPGELAMFLLTAPNETIRKMADEAKRTGIAPFAFGRQRG